MPDAVTLGSAEAPLAGAGDTATARGGNPQYAVFRVLLLHELLEHVRGRRFQWGAVICIAMSLLTAATRTSDALEAHAQRVELAQRWLPAVVEQLQRYEAVQVDSTRSVSPLTILSVGLEAITPFRFSSTKEGVRFGEARSAQSGVDALFGHVDLSFVVGTLLSLFAMVLAFDTVCGARKEGTLAVLLSYPVSRLVVLGAKVGAVMIVVGLCFLASAVVAIAVHFAAGLPMVGASHWIAYGALSMIYLLVFVAAGVAFSAAVREPATAMFICLCFWIGAVYLVPRALAVAVNEVVPPRRAVQLSLELDAAVSQLKVQQTNEQQQAYAEYLASPGGNANETLQKKLKESSTKLHDRRRVLLSSLLDRQAREDSLRESNIRMLSILSPTAVYHEAAAEVALTGRLQRQQFYRDARLYDDEIGRRLVESRRFLHGPGPGADRSNVMIIIDDVKPFLVPFQTTWVATATVLRSAATAIFTEAAMALLAFAAACWTFLRMDVRP